METYGIRSLPLASFESALRIKGLADVLIAIHDPSLAGVKTIA